ncbi:hypothetical protein ADL27_41760, partial [Streptomyces sp. NRRL F-6602]
TVDRLVRSGLVDKRPNPQDGRGTLASITDQGRVDGPVRRVPPIGPAAAPGAARRTAREPGRPKGETGLTAI